MVRGHADLEFVLWCIVIFYIEISSVFDNSVNYCYFGCCICDILIYFILSSVFYDSVIVFCL